MCTVSVCALLVLGTVCVCTVSVRALLVLGTVCVHC